MVDSKPDPDDVALRTTSRDEVRDVGGDHVLDSAVEFYEEYESAYDPETEELLLSPSHIEDKANAYTEYECSCGAFFTDQTEALQHLINATDS